MANAIRGRDCGYQAKIPDRLMRSLLIALAMKRSLPSELLLGSSGIWNRMHGVDYPLGCNENGKYFYQLAIGKKPPEFQIWPHLLTGFDNPSILYSASASAELRAARILSVRVDLPRLYQCRWFIPFALPFTVVLPFLLVWPNQC